MALDTLKKSAYVAVGIPADLLTKLRERVSTVRDGLDELRERVSDDAARVFEQWVEEGERLVASLGQRTERQRDEIEEAFERARGAARQTGEAIHDVGHSLAVSLTEPITPVDTIDGIGPGYAKRLAREGVVSTQALVDRCRTGDATARLARHTGISEQRLAKWAASADLTRIDGVGHETMSLFNAIGIGSLEQLGEADAGELHARASALNDEIGLLPAIPSERTLSTWIDEAATISGTASA